MAIRNDTWFYPYEPYWDRIVRILYAGNIIFTFHFFLAFINAVHAVRVMVCYVYLRIFYGECGTVATSYEQCGSYAVDTVVADLNADSVEGKIKIII